MKKGWLWLSVFTAILFGMGALAKNAAPIPTPAPSTVQAVVATPKPTPTPTIASTLTPTPMIEPTVAQTSTPTATASVKASTKSVITLKSTPTLNPNSTETAKQPSNLDTSSNDSYTNVDGNQVQRPVQSDTIPAGATARCVDGSYSFSQNHRGTCSHHGGVAQWL